MTKRAYWQVSKKHIDALIFTRKISIGIISLHGVAQAVSLDCNTHFTAPNWREVMMTLPMKLYISPALHSEIEGRTDNSNETVVFYLCGFRTDDQAN